METEIARGIARQTHACCQQRLREACDEGKGKKTREERRVTCSLPWI